MRFFKNLYIGLRAYAKALRFIFQYRFYWYILLPGALMPVVYRLGFGLMSTRHEPAGHSMNDLIWFMLGQLFEISIALMLMRFAKYLVVILFSPLLAHLSQRTEYILTGNTYGFSLPQLFSDIRRSLQIAIRNITWEYFFILLIFIVASLGWNPAAESPLFTIIYFTGFYYYGFSLIDYVNERRRLSMKESVWFLRAHRGLALAIGSIYSILLWIPVDFSAILDWSHFSDDATGFLFRFTKNVGLWVLGAFAPIWSIVAATIAMDDLVGLKNNPHARSAHRAQETEYN